MTVAPGTGGWPSSTSTGVVAGGIEFEERLAALPHPLLDQPDFEPVLGQRQPDEARVRAECVLQQRQHGAIVDEAPGRAGTAGIMRNAKAYSGESVQRRHGGNARR